MSSDTDQDDPLVALEDELPLERIRELLQQLSGEAQAEIGWELGIHCATLTEGLKEFAARLHGLEEENRLLQERLARGHQEYVELRESMDELLNLHELSEAISSSFNTDDILDSLMDLSKRFTDYESCGVFAVDESGENLEPMSLRDRDGRLAARVQAQWGDGIIDWVFREHHPVIIDDIETIDQQEGQECSFAIVPLIVRGEKIGIFTLYCRKAKDTFTAGEIELLGVLANQSAVAIENSRLYTDLESAHEQVVESQRQLLISAKLAAIGELAGGVAHEVNNPLQIILSRVQLMRIQHHSGEKITAGLALIENNVKRISKIIRALLGFSRHNSEAEEWGKYDLVAALQQACALVKHQLDSRMIDVDIDFEDQMPEMTGNVGELEQVFINLILNAQNAMSQGGHLHISAHREGEGVEIKFADTGTGIAAEHLDRIFEPFFTTRADEGGTGLGLAVSYRIIEMLEGTMTVESTQGKGTTFIIRLPPDPQRS